MPELPEVELVARSLNKLAAGRVVVSAKLLRAGLAPANAPRDFARRLRAATIESVARRGKHILARFDNGQVLITHLRMTGRFMLLRENGALPKHAHAVFNLDDSRRLVFTDQRHFGLMKIVRDSELDDTRELRHLAPEPFSDEFSTGYLAGVLARSRRKLKDVLLDQTKVNGLGNIYAAEALFIARANPFTSAAEFSRRRVPRLHRAILDALGEAVARGATMEVDPENIDGSYSGSDGGHWLVYDREGEPCSNCRARISRIAHAGRSTYFCPRCQRS
jgi:formamidopyrimidine-DNA glycosylase